MEQLSSQCISVSQRALEGLSPLPTVVTQSVMYLRLAFLPSLPPHHASWNHGINKPLSSGSALGRTQALRTKTLSQVLLPTPQSLSITPSRPVSFLTTL